MPVTTRRSRVFTISMPPEVANAAEFLAKCENRTMSELFREAFREYHRNRIGLILEETAKYAALKNPRGYAEEDIAHAVKEVRAEVRAEKETKRSLTPQ